MFPANAMKNIQLGFVLVSILACKVASDATEDIQEPCGSSDINKECVRQYFAEHSSCSVVSQPDDGPVLKERGVFYLPVVNTTAIDRNVTLKDLDGPIRKFYINNKTGNLIYSMKMTNVSYHCPSFTFYFHRMDEEPLIITDDFNETYPHTVLTAIIPLNNGRVTQESMLESKVSAFFLPEGNVTMNVGSKFVESEEPIVQAAMAGIMNNRLTAYKEAFVTEAPLRFIVYLQKYICDFGLPIKI